MLILGVYCGHDANACLLQDGDIVVCIEKERLTRVKGDRGNADICIQYCLDAAGVSLADVDYVATSRHVSSGHTRSGKFLSGIEYTQPQQLFSTHTIELLGQQVPCYNIQHHLGHAASAFFLSPMEEAAILSIDGGGDFTATMLAEGRGNTITILERPDCNLGFVWTALSTTLGFGARYSEGKIMALASYGEPTYYQELLDWCGGDFASFRVQGKRCTFQQALREIWHNDVQQLSQPAEGYHNIQFPFSADPWYGIPIFRGRVHKGDPLYVENRNLASSLQALTEDIMVYFAHWLYERTGLKKLCVVGGLVLTV